MNRKIELTSGFLFTLLLLTFHTVLAAGTIHQVDSLRQVIQNNTGEEKINAQLELANYYLEDDNNQAQSIAQSALISAKELNKRELQMRAFFVLGLIGHELNNVNQSQANFDSALTIANQLNDYSFQSDILLRTGINKHTQGEHLEALQAFNKSIQTGLQSNNFRATGASYSMMGTVFRVNGLYDRAIEYIIKARLNYEKAGYVDGYAWSAYLLGRIYTDLQLLDKAMEYYQLALETYEQLAQDDKNMSGVIICYEQIGIINLISGKTDEARKNIEYTLQIHEATGSKYGIANAYKNLGRIEYVSGNYALAKTHLTKALSSKIDMGDLLSQPSIHLYLGLCLVETGEPDAGIAEIKKGLEQAILNNQKRIQLDIYSKLSDIYLEHNDLQNALLCQQHQLSIQDSMLLGAANIKLEQLQGIYEVDAKNSQIADLQQQNEINRLQLKQHRTSNMLLILAILLAIIIASIIYIFYQRLRQKNIQLNEANMAKDKFFAIIAHDLRGPIHTQTSFLDHLYEEFDSLDENELKKLLKLLVSSSEHISDLLDNLLLWAQSQVKKMEVKTTALNLSDVITSTVDKLQQSAQLKQIRISLNTNNQLKVLSDANMLQTVVRNIVSNAIKFTPRGGSIRIETSSDEHRKVSITITDSGVGMTPEKLNKLFDISSKSHSQGTENEKSTGLGLILVKEFVERNNGTIQITSEPGKGTSVIVTLPEAN